MRVMIVILVWMLGPHLAQADGLDHRNIPDARLVHEDETGRYFAALMGHRDIHPSDTPESEVTLRIYAERTVSADGSYFDAAPGPALQYVGAQPVDGFRLTESEITRLNTSVIPEAIAAFPEWRAHPNWEHYKGAIIISFYIDGVLLYGKGPWGEKQENASYAAEQPVLWFSFTRQPDDGGWRPAYETSGLLGKAQSPTIRYISTVLGEREELPNSVGNDRAKVLAAFDRHEAYRSALQEKRRAAYVSAVEAARRPGVVYKSGSYWRRYSGFDTPRKIADGQFKFIEHPADFAQAFLTFIDQYYEQCDAYLPAIRTTFTKDWFETQYGVTTHTNRYYVEMDPRFEDQYKTMMGVVHRRNVSDTVMTYVNALGSGDGANVFGWVNHIFEVTATSLVEEAEMGAFIQAEGCTSPLIKQYADNLWQGAAGLTPVQDGTKRYEGASAATMPFEEADGVWHLEQSHAALARMTGRSEGEHPYLDEEVLAYRTGSGLANDGRDQNAAMRPIGRKIQEQGHPVLYCYYGPIGYLPNGEYDTFNVSFWYEETPKELPQLIAAKVQPHDLYPSLEHARSSCPETSSEALALIGR